MLFWSSFFDSLRFCCRGFVFRWRFLDLSQSLLATSSQRNAQFELVVIFRTFDLPSFEDDAAEFIPQEMVVLHFVGVRPVDQQIVLLRQEGKGQYQFAVACFLEFMQ